MSHYQQSLILFRVVPNHIAPLASPHSLLTPLFLCPPPPVGQDCYTRLWSLQDGQLLRTIPSPHPAAKDLIPSVVFSSRLGGRRGLPGLLMAVKHDLYYFSYNTDPQDTTTGEPVH